MTIAATAVALAGCGGGSGGDDNAEIGRVVKSVVERAASGDSSSLISADPSDPIYSEPKVGAPRVVGVRIQHGEGGTATVRGEVQRTLTVAHKPSKASLLRPEAAPAETTRTVSQPFISAVQKEEDKWVVPPGDTVQINDVRQSLPLSQSAQERARQTAITAVRTLFRFDGDRDAYNRAQNEFYPTKSADQADFTQRGFDPAPTLGAKSLRRDHADQGTAWARTNDGGEDDLPLSYVTEFPGKGYPGLSSGCAHLRAQRVTGRVDQSSASAPSAGLLDQSVFVTGRALVEAGDRTCGRRHNGVEYQAALRRIQGDGGHPWFVTSLKLSRPGAGLAPSTGGLLYTLIDEPGTIAP